MLGKCLSRPWFWLLLLVGLVCLGLAAADLVVGDASRAFYLLRAGLGTWLVMPLYLLALRLARPWPRRLSDRLRGRLGLDEAAAAPGVGWLWFATHTALAGAALFGLLACWTPRGHAVDWLAAWNRGLPVGAWQFTPAAVFGALIALGVLQASTELLVASLSRRLGRRADLDVGARETALTIVTHAGRLIAILAMLHVLFGGFPQLTILAGALTVGIGFGLQNLVNNFVAGLIVLFERPVRVGDWAKVGATEGRVRAITVRHTELETAAGAQVFVPNSEFITQHVVNETRYDPRGRLEVVVKVTREADPVFVRQTLLDIAAAHAEVVHDAEPPPTVLLRGLEGGCEFVLWCVLTDASRRPQVRSDLLFAIHRALVDHGLS
ncbi:MAG: mechanosensitive ion channel [Armatimonadetes bacterium]|nr:mechanosensitive ion channel [Armatimonadota bacterium]